MFRHRHLHHRQQFGRLSDVRDLAAPFGARRVWRRGGFGFRRRTPTAVKILLAGLAVFAFVALTRAAGRSGSG